MSSRSSESATGWEAAWRRVPGPLRVLLAVGVLPQALLWAIGSYLYLPFGYFSLDYLLLAAVFALLPRLLAAGALGALFLVDAVLRLGAAYGLQPAKLVESAEVLLLFDPTQVGLAVGALVAVAAVVAGLAVYLTRDVEVRPLEVGALVVVGGLVLSVSAFGWQPYVNEEGRYVVPDKPIASSLGRLWQGIQNVRTANSGTPVRVGIPAASAGLHEALRAGETPEKVVLVIGEGLGLFTSDPESPKLARGTKGRRQARRLLEQDPLNRALWSVFEDSALVARYEIETGVVPIPEKGGTVDAELRELCRVYSGQRPNPALLPRDDCFPELAEARGYQTVGVHGHAGGFFRRDNWWVGLGFEEVWFTDKLSREAGLKPDCPPSVYPEALCDSDVAKFITDRYLEANGRQFVYWLTISAHQPVGTPDPARARFPCEKHRATRQSEALCHELQLQEVVLRQVREMALATDEPAHIVLVGDHEVHFFRADDSQHVRDGWVPYVILRPRTGAAATAEAEG